MAIRPSAHPFVCDVEVSWSHRSEYFENDFIAD